MVRGGKGLQDLFVLRNESSRERIVLRTNVPAFVEIIDNSWSKYCGYLQQQKDRADCKENSQL